MHTLLLPQGSLTAVQAVAHIRDICHCSGRHIELALRLGQQLESLLLGRLDCRPGKFFLLIHVAFCLALDGGHPTITRNKSVTETMKYMIRKYACGTGQARDMYTLMMPVKESRDTGKLSAV